MSSEQALQPKELRNAVVNIVGEGLWGTTSAMISSATVLVVALRELGAGRTMIGSISTIETISVMLPQLAGLFLFRSSAALKNRIIGFHFVVVIPAIFLMGFLLLAEPRLGATLTRYSVLVAYGLFMGSIGVIGAVWMDWLARIFRVDLRGTVMGFAFCSSAACGTLSALAVGAWLRHAHGVHPYALLYLAAGAVACLSLTTFWLVDDPGVGDDDTPRPSLKSIRSDFAHSLSDSNFRSFLVGRMLAGAGFCIVPLIADYYSSPLGGGVSAGALVSCGAAMTVGSALANVTFGRIGDVHGHRLGLIVGACFQIVALCVLLLGAGTIACVAAYFCAGVSAASGFISHFNMVFETCPHDNRRAHIVVASLTVGSVTFLMPLFAGFVASHFGTRTTFTACLLFSIAALVWVITQVREPRRMAMANAES